MLNFKRELQLSNNIIGVDEVGRGPLAGPVVAAAVILNPDICLKEINDSKKISKKRRDKVFFKIINHSKFAIGFSSVEEIEKYNILQASLMAMKRAVTSLGILKSTILVDGIHSFDKKNKKILTFVKGDEQFPSIAAASVLAKVIRDKYICILAKKYKRYGWEKNSGYGTSEHMEAMKKFGLTPLHRKNFAPVHKMLLNK